MEIKGEKYGKLHFELYGGGVDSLLAKAENAPVIETGSDDFWNWVKYDNGVAYLWRTYAYTVSSSWNTHNSVSLYYPSYTGDYIGGVDYPFTFVERPAEFCHINGEIDQRTTFLSAASYCGNTSSTCGIYKPLRIGDAASATNLQVNYSLFVVGMWK